MAYEVIEPVRKLENDDWMLQIRVISTNEELGYLYSEFLNDPVAVTIP